MSKTVIVIGGGPGGYTAAIRAAQLGADVHIAEKNALGGTCLNVGCIPTKVLIHTADEFRKLPLEVSNGLTAENPQVNWEALQKHKKTVVKKLVRGVKGLLAANGVTMHPGTASVRSDRTVVFEDGSSLCADVVILATGSEPVKIPFEGNTLPGVTDSTGALGFEQLPKRLCIMGGGVIGTEFAYLFNALGSSVDVVEMMPQILPPIDRDVSAVLRDSLTKQGVRFHTDTRLEKAEQTEDGLLVFAAGGENVLQIPCDALVVAIGRRPNTAGLGLDKAGIVVSKRGYIVTDENFETSVPGVFAIGDCNGQIMLAHAATAQGVAAVEYALGETPNYHGDIVPSCVYTSPEASGVGLTEQAAEAGGIPYKAGIFSLAGNGKSLIEGDQTGFIKILTNPDSGKIIGVHMAGPHVTEMIGEAALAMHMGATARDIAATIHPHPTVNEAIGDAALDVYGAALNWPPKK